MNLLECLKSIRSMFARIKGKGDASVDPPSDIGLVAYRRAGDDGWDVQAINQSYDASVAEIRSKTSPDVEVRRIFGSGDLDSIQDLEGRWMRDFEARKWRAPGELLTQPRTPSTQVRKISITFEPPDAGWIVFRIEAGNQSVDIWSSWIFDPFPDLVAVLENLSRGVGGRVTIDSEGRYEDVHCYALEESDLVRFIVTTEPSGEKVDKRDVLIDVTTDRSGFVQSAYSSMVGFWTSKDFLENKREWSSDDSEIGFHAEDFGEYRSKLLDRKFAFNDGSTMSAGS